MNVCFMCDLHLPFDTNALQYTAWEWAIEDMRKNDTDCVVFVGDATADGNLAVYKRFIERMNGLGIPFLYIPGNSDLRDISSRKEIYALASACVNEVAGVKIYAVNDSNCDIAEEQLRLLESANDDSLVFMHHPIGCIKQATRERLLAWKNSHRQTKLFFGHEHYAMETEFGISLPAIDPDKAIGENPSILYYDTQTKRYRQAYYECPMPSNMREYLGISCYKPIEHIKFAVENRLQYLELRPNIVKANQEEVVSWIALWRQRGGKNLSIHLSEVSFDGACVTAESSYESLIALGIRLKAERYTQHVPIVSVKTVKEDKTVLENIASYIADRVNAIPYPCTIGVENMHMTAMDEPNDNRRFGYTPEETLAFMLAVQEKCKHKVGVNLDVGHARNNAPYSQKYQISTWYAMLGKHIVGYHLHQVTVGQEKFENHMPITEFYGRLISCASFFKCWELGKINEAPCIFEMRPENAYSITLETFTK